MTTRQSLIEQINTLTDEMNMMDEIYEGNFPEPSEQLDRHNELYDKRQALIKELHSHITDDEMKHFYDLFVASLGYTPKTHTLEDFKKTTSFWVYMPERNKD